MVSTARARQSALATLAPAPQDLAGSLEQAIAGAVYAQFATIGEDPDREGLRETPARVARAWRDLTCGYDEDPAALLAVQFSTPCDAMVVVRAVPYWSLCEHHLLPFWGTATLGYIPQAGRVVGLSKLARLVHCYSRRLQMQERLTSELAEALMTYLQPLGVGAVLTGQHTCMQMRGIATPGEMFTSALLGVFQHNPVTRAEFLGLVPK